MNPKHRILLTLPLALFPVLVFASGGEQACSSQDFFQIVRNIFLVVVATGSLLIVAIFYPKRFKKKNKELKDAQSRSSLFMEISYYLFILFFALIVIALLVLDGLPKDIFFYFIVAIIIATIAFFGAFVSRRHRLVGCKVLNMGGEIEKFLGTERSALIYFFDSKLFERQLASENMSRGGIWIKNDPEKKIKEMNWLLENIKPKIKVFELSPIENKDVFDKFRLSDGLNKMLSLTSGVSGIVNNVPLVVVISEGYIKEYWLGHNECKSGLVNFDVNKIGSIEVPTRRTKIISSTAVMLFVIFMGFIYILSTKCADYFSDSLNILSFLLIFLGLPILALKISSMEQVKMPAQYLDYDEKLKKEDEIKTSNSAWKLYKKVMMKCFAWTFILTIIFSVVILTIGRVFFWEVTTDYNPIKVFCNFTAGLLLMVPICSFLIAPIIGLKMVALKKSHESIMAGIYLILSVILGVLWIFFLAYLDV